MQASKEILCTSTTYATTHGQTDRCAHWRQMMRPSVLVPSIHRVSTDEPNRTCDRLTAPDNRSDVSRTAPEENYCNRRGDLRSAHALRRSVHFHGRVFFRLIKISLLPRTYYRLRDAMVGSPGVGEVHPDRSWARCWVDRSHARRVSCTYTYERVELEGARERAHRPS